MKDYLSVNEFSKLTGIEKTTLRYWDEIGLFSPVKRDPENNYRYYSPEQLIAVNFITVLSGLNVPLKTIGVLGERRTPESVTRLIEQREKQLDMEMRRLRECYSIIHERLELIRYGTRVCGGFKAVNGVRLDGDAGIDSGTPVDEAKISVLHREDKMYIFGPPNHFRENEAFYEPFMRFCRQAEELRINLNFPVGGYHENMDSFLASPGKPDRFISMDPTGNQKRAEGDYLVGFSRGYYGELGDLPERLKAYAEENALRLSGPVYTIYLHDEICVKDPGQYLAQVCVEAVKR